MKVGIDIGGTTIKFGFFDSSLTLLGETVIDTNQDYSVSLESIEKVLRSKTDIESVGVGLPGVIDAETGRVVRAISLPRWTGQNLLGDITRFVHVPVKVHNDAACAAFAEAVLGRGVSKSKFIYMIWGTGVGGTVIERIEGKIHASPMEPGYQIIEWAGLPYKGAQKGSLSSYVAGGVIESVYGKPASQIPEDDPTWSSIAQKMAQGLINTVVHHPCDLIVFGGGVANKQPHLLDKIRAYMKEELMILDLPELMLAKHGEKSGIYGAAALPSMEFL